MPSGCNKDHAASQCEKHQCAADVEDEVGIGELVNLEGAGRYAAHVDGVAAGLIAADGELYGGMAAAGERDALMSLFLPVDVECDLV